VRARAHATLSAWRAVRVPPSYHRSIRRHGVLLSRHINAGGREFASGCLCARRRPAGPSPTRACVPVLYVRAADLGGTAACCRRTELPPRPPGVIRVFLSHGPRASSATAAGHWRLGRHNSARVPPHACVVQDDASSAHDCV
jgi:hypothetical protein